MTDKIDDLDSFDFNPSVVDGSSVAPIEEDPLMTPVEPIQEIPHILKQYLTDEEQQQVRNLYSSNRRKLDKIASKYIACIDSDEEEKVDIKKCQEDFIKNIRAFLKKQNKKGGRKKRRKTRRKSKKRKRKTKRRRKKRKTKRGGAHIWGNYADFYNYLKEIDEKHQAETGEEEGSLGAPYTFRYIDSGLEETEALAHKEADEDGTYIFTFWITSEDPELLMTHNFDSGDILDGEEPYEEVQFKIPLLWRPEPEGGGRKKKRKTKKRRR